MLDFLVLPISGFTVSGYERMSGSVVGKSRFTKYLVVHGLIDHQLTFILSSRRPKFTTRNYFGIKHLKWSLTWSLQSIRWGRYQVNLFCSNGYILTHMQINNFLSQSYYHIYFFLFYLSLGEFLWNIQPWWVKFCFRAPVKLFAELHGATKAPSELRKAQFERHRHTQ